MNEKVKKKRTKQKKNNHPSSNISFMQLAFCGTKSIARIKLKNSNLYTK